MSSKREEERNEKIVRGLMKLPPNRRCINCNSLGPQYVCTNFWTFVCITCSGIHREFTHRVKSVSMAKFTSQEVDALQKGGNQRARELLLKAWDMQKNRLPDNSNIDKVREFIKNVYVDKKYALEKSSDRPPRDPQSLRSHEEETRRASSYHSYSKSPPYDFQYEERRYGKHAPALTRKPGSSEFPQLHTVLHNSDANNRSNGGKTLHLQRTESSGSYGSFDSSSMRPVNSLGSPEVVPKPEQTAEISHDRSSSLPSLPQSSASRTFDGLDFFSAAFAPQDITSTPPTGSQSELPQSSVAYSVNFVDQSPISSVSTFTEQQPSQILQSLPLDLFSALPQQQSAASNGKACDAVVPNSGGWATFDMPQNAVPMGTENSAPAVVPSSDGNIKGNFNPFSIYQSCSYQDSAGHETSASTHTFGHAGIQNVGATINNTHLWTAFEDSAGSQPIQNMLKNNEQAALPSALDADNSLGFGDFNDDGNVRTTVETEPPSSSLSPNFSTALNDFPVADMHSFVNVHKPINPFDLHFDSELKSSDMSQFWDMSSLQAALPSAPKSPSYTIGGGNQSWVPQNSLPSYVPGVTFDPTTGSLGFIAGQAPSAQIPNIHAQGPVASVGGNPFA